MKGYRLGAVDYIFLPVIPELLKAKVGAFVKLAHQRQIIQRQAEDMAEKNRELAARFETIQQLNAKLHDTVQELESYMYTVSHDLRAPLRHMNSFCEVLMEEYGATLDEPAHKLIGGIKKAAFTMDKLTTDLLEYSRIMRTEVQLHSISLTELFAQVINSAPALHAPGVQITVEPHLHP